MKKIIILSTFFALLSFITTAQTRKYIAQFSHMQGYFNPALTGYEGSAVRGLVRNQWVGFEGAPKTYFASVELDLMELSGKKDLMDANKNTFGFNFMNDQYGVFSETEMMGNYSSRIQLNEVTGLRLGAGVSYKNISLDGTRLSPDQPADPKIMQYLNGFANMQILDFNLGIAVTHPNYYLSYAVQNVNRGMINSGDVFMERSPRIGIFQGGFRNTVTEDMSLSFNIFYRHQKNLPSNTEFNFKVLMMDKIWLGLGHRVGYAHNFQLGFVFPMVRLGYVYEIPMSKSYLLPNTTHEFLAIIPLFRKNFKESSNEVLIW
ncbi:type IX secretion system membrane protein PorP/SprF [Aquiflexum gelatinilyticum]|uniref:Type IX secretion system membrane protein PorP/SprF n=1 Tax=Aquiflexum gelatinilyticum TaxID=2961943 RepID=A0A9X2P5K3_9BACT|nr:type IX secretion system membrane protein PorP/SprF [Aquiflexum gelatinilyticum]MCR9016403.1 type IX secretion system membrane protein PorP/SprF [Aquiflexum gelatinilyticum]